MANSLDELFSDRQLKRDPDVLAQWGCDWTRSYSVAPSAVVFVESICTDLDLVESNIRQTKLSSPDYATADPAEITAFARERLAGFKTPKTVIFQDLPKTSTGKIQKFVIREQAEQI